ncbi:MAG: ABC transporter permease [Acidimicrobiales bacterium]
MTSTMGAGAELEVRAKLEQAKPRPAGKAPRRERLGPVVVFAAFIGLWYLISAWAIEAVFNKPKFLVPPPHEVIAESFFNSGKVRSEMFRGVWLSAQVAFLGLLIAIVVGMALAILMSRARWIEKSLFPYAVALQAVPILAFVPLIGSFLGFNFTARVFVCIVISLFPIIANTLFGLLSAEAGQHDLFTLHGAGKLKRLVKLQLPAAMPSIFTGFRISAGLSVIGAVVGDFFFRQGEAGIGRLIDVYRSRTDNPQMYGAVILAALLGIGVFWLFGLLSRVAVGRWHETTGQS